MRLLVLALAAAAASAGCTSAALERYTVSQIQSAADYRAEATLHCLAAVAAEPGTLPAFATLADGTTSVKDTGNLSATTTWARAVGGFAMQALAPMASRSPNELWTIDPVADYTRLEAMRCACRWVVYGPELACGDCPGILTDPETDPSPGPHFGVLGRLARLPGGWLHVGHLKDVPAHARYRAHCGDAWVWVMPDGMAGLSEFILVLHDIATIDVDFGATVSPPVLVTLVQWQPLPSYKITEAVLDALRADKTDPAILAKLRTLIPRPLATYEDFLRALRGALTPDELVGVRDKVLRQAQRPDQSFELTDAALAALAEAITNKDVLDKLKTLKGKRFASRDAFLQALAALPLSDDQLTGVQGKVLKQAQQANLPYSKQLTFGDIRAIDPGRLGELRKQMLDAVASGRPAPTTWEQWLAYTKPYHGIRTNVKPEGSVSPTLPPVPSRLLPPGTVPAPNDWILRATVLEQGPPVKGPAPNP